MEGSRETQFLQPSVKWVEAFFCRPEVLIRRQKLGAGHRSHRQQAIQTPDEVTFEPGIQRYKSVQPLSSGGKLDNGFALHHAAHERSLFCQQHHMIYAVLLEEVEKSPRFAEAHSRVYRAGIDLHGVRETFFRIRRQKRRVHVNIQYRVTQHELTVLYCLDAMTGTSLAARAPEGNRRRPRSDRGSPGNDRKSPASRLLHCR
ncbi:MAG: hypothetical protein BWY79_01798 [Actinobacteria bacterium ADurb.Bin444]|nr:MAG: hypothetical protein BWY79_01798 [Actinobacteria bacterium ADurb.Bin444]